MEGNRKKIPHPYDKQDERFLFDDTFKVSSSTDCTGLIPSAPASEAEVDSYSEIYDIPLASDAAEANNEFKNPHKYKNDIQMPKKEDFYRGSHK